MLVHDGRAIRADQHRLLRGVHSLYRDVHFRKHGARDGELGVDFGLRRRVLEIDRAVVTILLLAQVERELVVNSQIVWNADRSDVAQFNFISYNNCISF